MGSPFQAELMLLGYYLAVTLHHILFTCCFAYDVCVWRINLTEWLIDWWICGTQLLDLVGAVRLAVRPCSFRPQPSATRRPLRLRVPLGPRRRRGGGKRPPGRRASPSTLQLQRDGSRAVRRGPERRDGAQIRRELPVFGRRISAEADRAQYQRHHDHRGHQGDVGCLVWSTDEEGDRAVRRDIV